MTFLTLAFERAAGFLAGSSIFDMLLVIICLVFVDTSFFWSFFFATRLAPGEVVLVIDAVCSVLVPESSGGRVALAAAILLVMIWNGTMML